MKRKETKSQPITREMVWNAYKVVRTKGKGAGVDGLSLKAYRSEAPNQLYKLWNRLSSGSYYPPPVREKIISKNGGGERKLGIPTVSDRIAQMVVKQYLEPRLEAIFHPDSYGYRPGRGAQQAVARCRARCYQHSWVIDMDIKGFFDHLSHDLLGKALARHVSPESEKWVLIYIDRWLSADIKQEDGSRVARKRGTPQGGVISPLLANLFLHYTFDMWMKLHYPQVGFERYADDIIVHCNSQQEAEALLDSIRRRMRECELELHPEKTRIVYCKSSNRSGSYPRKRFTFLGFDFQPRPAKTPQGRMYLVFSPAVGRKAQQKLLEKVNRMLGSHRTHLKLEEVLIEVNSLLRGWMAYFRHFRPSAMRDALHKVDRRLLRWAQRKYKRLRTNQAKARAWLHSVYRSRPWLLEHWLAGFKPG